MRVLLCSWTSRARAVHLQTLESSWGVLIAAGPSVQGKANDHGMFHATVTLRALRISEVFGSNAKTSMYFVIDTVPAPYCVRQDLP